MPKKILILCTKFPYPPKDGGTFAMLNMVRAFHKAGHAVTVLTMNTPKHYVNLRQLPDEIRRISEFNAVEVNTDVNYIDALANLIFGGVVGSRKSYHVARFTSAHFRNELIYLLKKYAYDIVQLETLYMAPYLRTVAEFAPEALRVLRTHNIEHEIWYRRAENEKNPIKKYYFEVTADRIREYEEKVIQRRKYDVIVPITGKDMGTFKKLGASEPIQFCNVGIDKDSIDQAPVPLEYPSVFFLGALDWEPNREGLRWFLKFVWPMVNRTYPKVKFYIAGRNMSREFTRIEGNNIIIAGEVKSAPKFIKSKGIMIAPVFSGSGMRVKIIEGMAYGKAIVATTLAAEGISAKHGYHIMLADTPEEFFHAISILIDEPNRYHTIGTHAKDLSLNSYDNDVLVGRLLGFYESRIKAKQEKSKQEVNK